MFLMMAPLFSRYGLHAAAKGSGSWYVARRTMCLCFPQYTQFSTVPRGRRGLISRGPSALDLRRIPYLHTYLALDRICFYLPPHDASKRDFRSRRGVRQQRREVSGRRAKRGLLHGESSELCQGRVGTHSQQRLLPTCLFTLSSYFLMPLGSQVLRLYAILLEHAMSFDGDGYKEIAVATRYLGHALGKSKQTCFALQ